MSFMKKIKSINLDIIILKSETQHRHKKFDEHIKNIRDSILECNEIEPIQVIEAIEEDAKGKYYLVDGYHRYEGTHLAGKKTINCHVIKKGTEYDAIIKALSANSEHEPKLPRSRSDIANACAQACRLLFKEARDRALRQNNIRQFYPKVDMYEVQKLVICKINAAKIATDSFNEFMQIKRDNSIIKDLDSGRTAKSLESKYGLKASGINSVKSRYKGRSNPENEKNLLGKPGKLGKKGEIMSEKISIDEIHGSPKCTHRESELDEIVEADLKAYLLEEKFFDGADSYQTSSERQCLAGTIDILATNEIVEIKRFLTRYNIFLALGQLIIYNEGISERKKLTIAGIYHKDVDRLKDFIKRAGFDVVLINENGQIKRYIKGIANGIN